MTLIILTMKIRHVCPLSTPIGRTEGVGATHLCHRGKDVLLEVRGKDAEVVRAMLEEYRALGGKSLFDDPDGPSAMLRFPTCACCQTGGIIPAMEKAGYLYLPPTVYDREGERYEFLGTREEDGQRAVDGLKDRVTLDAIYVRPVKNLGSGDGLLVPSGVLFSDITARQRQALLLAMDRGYYQIPRDVRTEDLAKVLGVSREAFEALLRKAENKLIRAVGPYLQLSAGSGADGPGSCEKGRREEPFAPPMSPIRHPFFVVSHGVPITERTME